MKTVEDTECSKEMALAWSVSATNALQNRNGYAPNQLVFGRNVNLPSLSSDKPPALKSSTTDIVRQHLNAMHSARENFMKVDSSNRIRKALNSQVRTYSEIIYESGEKVYFKRRKAKGWCGPAKVLGKEGNFVLIRQGSHFYRCHPCHLMKVNPVGGNDSAAVNSASSEVKKVLPKKRRGEYMFDISDSDNDTEKIEAETGNEISAAEDIVSTVNEDGVEPNEYEENRRNDTTADDTREDEEESLDNSVEANQPLDGADEGRRDRSVSDLCIQLENSF